MKLLFDQNVSFRIVKKLEDAFPGCSHISNCGLMDSEDQEIWNYARKNNYSIVTFDSDFFDISVINGHPPKIIWIRSGNLRTEEIALLLTQKQSIIHEFLTKQEYEDVSCLEID